ncbi:MAG: Ig-like domain-containing protein [Planctomycetota bacterium]|jgi:hypothetical protein
MRTIRIAVLVAAAVCVASSLQPGWAGAANQPPVANDQSLTVLNLDSRVRKTLSYTDPDGGPSRTFTLVSAPAHGTLEYVSGSYKPVPVGTPVTARYWYYTPQSGYVGADGFTWKMSDGIAESNTATCSITVNANTPPVANDSDVDVVSDNPRCRTAPWGTDPDRGQSLTYTLVSPPSHGTMEYYPDNSYIPLQVGVPVGTNSWYYTSDSGYLGTDSFTWKMSDGFAESNTATVSITLHANVVPVAQDQQVSAMSGVEVEIPLCVVDPNMRQGQTMVVTVLSGPSHGTLTTRNSNGFILPKAWYTSDAAFTGVDSFTWNVNDGMVDSNTVTCTIRVRNAGDQGGRLVILVVNDLLLPQIQSEVDRLKDDIANQGYTSKIKSWDTASYGARDLWDYLKAEYQSQSQVLAGAILIGNIPRSKGPPT